MYLDGSASRPEIQRRRGDDSSSGLCKRELAPIVHKPLKELRFPGIRIPFLACLGSKEGLEPVLSWPPHERKPISRRCEGNRCGQSGIACRDQKRDRTAATRATHPDTTSIDGFVERQNGSKEGHCIISRTIPAVPPVAFRRVSLPG